MITVVICSVSDTLLTNVKQNILNTVGVPCEILAYDNREQRKGICEVYNRGAQDAKYDIICYMHEDIKIITNNWGIKVLQLFENHTSLGAIGVAGSTYKPLAPSGWGAPDIQNKITYQNFIQYYKNSTKAPELRHSNSSTGKLAEVVCIDGLWFCTKKDIVLEYPFDEILLKAFHGYDIDFCLSILGKYKIAVTFEILLEHFSEGSYDTTWVVDTLKVHDKWRNYLPANSTDITKEQMILFEKRAFKHFFKEHAARLSLSFYFKLIKKYSSVEVFKAVSPKLYYYALKFKLSRYIKN